MDTEYIDIQVERVSYDPYIHNSFTYLLDSTVNVLNLPRKFIIYDSRVNFGP